MAHWYLTKIIDASHLAIFMIRHIRFNILLTYQIFR